MAVVPKKKTVSFPISVWFAPDTGHIHLARPTDDGFVTTINCRPGSARCHVHLYNALGRALVQSGAPGPVVGPHEAVVDD